MQDLRCVRGIFWTRERCVLDACKLSCTVPQMLYIFQYTYKYTILYLKCCTYSNIHTSIPYLSWFFTRATLNNNNKNQWLNLQCNLAYTYVTCCLSKNLNCIDKCTQTFIFECYKRNIQVLGERSLNLYIYKPSYYLPKTKKLYFAQGDAIIITDLKTPQHT